QLLHLTTFVCNSRGQMKVFLPNKLLERLPQTTSLPKERLRWNTNEEIASYLITFDRHEEWLSCSLKTRPQNGSIFLYNRKKIKYRKDGYCWKKRKDGKTTREDHMKLKVQGIECLYGCYVHSSIVPTFHRRCYWLLQNPDMVLVHYLNVPSLEDHGKACGPLLCAVADRRDSLRWSRDELLAQLKPMFHSIKWSCGEGYGSSEFSIEQLAQQILESQQTKPQPRTHTCLCSSTLANIPHRCNSTKHRIISPKLPATSPAMSKPSPHTHPPPSHTHSQAKLGGSTSLVGRHEGVSSSPSPPSSSSSSSSSPPQAHRTATIAVSNGTTNSFYGDQRGGLLLTPSPSPSLLHPLPTAAPSPSPCQPPVFDPDSFLNSPKQGQTYGGTLPPSSPSPPPSSSSPHAPSLTLSLSPTSPPPCSSPPSSLSSLSSEAERKNEERVVLQTSAPSSSLPPTLSLSLSPSHSAPSSSLPPSLSLSLSPLFPTGVRYMVPPQPSPSSSFLPFPPLPPNNGTELQRLATITDFSPEWSYPEGGVKVLITGPWLEATGRYSCVFDQSTVPASLIQPGVLRSYCPAHEAGLVSLHIVEDSGSVSSSVLFEYRARNASSLPSSQLDWLSLDDNQFRMSILDRLEQMERRMAEMSATNPHTQPPPQCQRISTLSPHTPPPEDRSQSGPWFERRIVGVCERMMEGGRWRGGGEERLAHSVRHRGMTLLHLAAAQGYTHLIHTLIHWRRVNSDSLDVEQEVDPLTVDHFSCTPLMWACALGHQAAAEVLYGWNSQALGIPDSLGRLPLAVARSRGHTCLARAAEEGEQRTTPTPQLPPSPLSTSPDTGGPHTPTLPFKRLGTLRNILVFERKAQFFLNAGPRDPLFLMDYEPAPPHSPPGPPHSHTSPPFSFCPQVDMATLAEQIIEATPERIKQEELSRGAESPLRERRDNTVISDTMPWLATYLDTHTHSSLSSTLALQRLRPPSSVAWAEFLNASANGRMERDFALLTLTDSEQRELYEAARIIQNAFRRYKGRRLKEQQDMAAAVIQRCYRKYKQLTWIALKYALYKRMTQAAILIQSKFRSYYEQKKFQQSRRAAVLIQQYYRSYKEYERLKQGPRGSGSHNPKLKGSFLTKKQDQAARKIMRFLRRCRTPVSDLTAMSQ
uniref:CG-1 domain-containing protein n=1 Tax=Oncorhynchus kisutch TaxID=8019 RepID=A0A8C7JCW3_ONCKI